jgi:hypothetical protein
MAEALPVDSIIVSSAKVAIIDSVRLAALQCIAGTKWPYDTALGYARIDRGEICVLILTFSEEVSSMQAGF